eukprot:scaffold10507_cov24-Prasinocladus_malaysianus.AAC.4
MITRSSLPSVTLQYDRRCLTAQYASAAMQCVQTSVTVHLVTGDVMGAIGDASKATADKGRILVEHAADKLVELLLEVDRFPLDFFSNTAMPQSASGTRGMTVAQIAKEDSDKAQQLVE